MEEEMAQDTYRVFPVTVDPVTRADVVTEFCYAPGGLSKAEALQALRQLCWMNASKADPDDGVIVKRTRRVFYFFEVTQALAMSYREILDVLDPSVGG